MTNLWPLGLLLCSCLMTTMARHSKTKDVPKYWVLFPQTLRAGSTMGVGLYITGVKGDVNVRLDLYDYEGNTIQNGQTYSVCPGDGFQVINFTLSEKLKKPFYSAFMRVKAWGAMEFDRFQRMEWRNRRITVLLQVERTQYRPGMTVKFRTLAMYSNGIVSDEPIEIVMRDYLHNQVAKWKGTKSNQGVIEGEMLLPNDPVLGEYSLEARAKGAARKKIFTVLEYDEPDFELKLWISRADFHDEYITAKVFALYTIGTAVTGTGTLTVQIPRYGYWWWYSRYHIKEVTKQFKTDKYGKAVIKFPMKEMKLIICRYYYPWYWYRYRYRCYYSSYYLKYRSVKFIASATDQASHQVVKKAKDIYITAHKTHLKFTSDNVWKFKPSLPLHIYVQDAKTNGRPNKKPLKPFLNITVTYTNSTRCSGRYWYSWYWRRSAWYTHVQTTADLDAEKIATLKTTIPDDACTVRIKATNGKFTASRFLSKYYSKNGTYLYMELDKTLSVDKKRTVTVMSNRKFGNFTAQGYSQGSLVMSKRVVVKEFALEHKFHFDVNESMVPVFHLVCYFMHPSDEIIADALSVPVEFISNKMRLHIDGETEAKVDPDEKITVRVNADLGTTVFLLGKDHRDLTGRNNIKQEDAIKGRLAHDTSSYGNKYVYEDDVFDMFRNTGLGFVTNYYVPGRYYYHYYYAPRPFIWSHYYYYRYGRSVYYECKRFGPFARPPGRMLRLVKKYPTEDEELYLPPNVVWEAVNVTSEVQTVKVNAPKALTSVNITGYGVHAKTGLNFVPIPLMFTVERRVFVVIYSPPSAVLGETVCMNVVAHNTGDKNGTLSLKLKKSSDFDNVKIKKDGEKRTEELNTENLERKLGMIEAGTKAVEVFCIKPKVTGNIIVQVSVSGEGKYDLEKSINIKPEGLKRAKIYQFLVEISPSKNFSATATVNLPSDVVDKSFSVSAFVAGDPLLATIHKLSDLTMTPTGCGEENVLQLSQLSNIIAYMPKTDNMPEELLEKAKYTLMAVYMQQLSYRHHDGSFSAFGNTDHYGSSRLTAIVMESLVAAWGLGLDGLCPEPDVLKRCADFLTVHQNPDGSFEEKGRVLHLDTQGKSAANYVSRTALIAIALQNTKKYFQSMGLKISLVRVENALYLAGGFLEKNLDTENIYSLCITAYALTLMGSTKATEAVEKMNKTSTVDGDKTYWDGKNEDRSIEITSYALLTLMARGAEGDAERVYKWLYAKRRAYGEFDSVQSSLIGVRALASMTKMAAKEKFNNITVDVNVAYKKTAKKTKGKSVDFKVTPSNAYKLQKSDVKWRNKHKPLEIKVDGTVTSTSEKMYAYVEVRVNFHSKSITKSGKLSTSVKVLENEVRSFKLHTCVERMSSDSQTDHHLIMTDVYLPSGYAFNKTASTYGSEVEKARLDDNKLTMYVSRLNNQVCSTLKFDMVKSNVAHIKPSRVLVTNKYNSDEMCLTDYSLEDQGVCDVANDHPGCKDE